MVFVWVAMGFAILPGQSLSSQVPLRRNMGKAPPSPMGPSQPAWPVGEWCGGAPSAPANATGGSVGIGARVVCSPTCPHGAPPTTSSFTAIMRSVIRGFPALCDRVHLSGPNMRD